MRTIIVLAIFAVLPISCRFYLNRKFAGDDEARQIAQKMIDTMLLAVKTRDGDLFLSFFDKSFILDDCGMHRTFADLEEKVRKESKNKPTEVHVPKYEVVKAVIDGEYLKFEMKNAAHSSSITNKLVAIRDGAEFKLIKAKIEICG